MNRQEYNTRAVIDAFASGNVRRWEQGYFYKAERLLAAKLRARGNLTRAEASYVRHIESFE